METINRYIDSLGNIKVWPSKRIDKITVLKYLVKKFEYNKFYSEKEVNNIIIESHSFNDYFLLRRELADNKLLCRTRDGARYWRGDFLSEKPLDTQRTTLLYYKEQDISELKDVYISCGYMKEYTGIEHKEEYIVQCFNNPELPPKGSGEFIRFRSIRSKETDRVIGALEYYMGYPDFETIWIGGLFLHKNYQQRGYGKEVVKEFEKKAKESGFKKAGVGVYLKNWQALRFWTDCGFNTIGGISGDKVYGVDKFSAVRLVNNL